MNARLMGRAAAGVGALVAAGAVTLVVVGGTANAAGTGRCTDNVNVRESPDITSEIVAVCERGQAVQVGKTQDGFVQLTDLDGWAAQEYVSVDGRAPAASARPTTTPSSHRSGSTGDDEEMGTTSTATTDRRGGRGRRRRVREHRRRTQQQPKRSPLGGAARLTGAAGRARGAHPAVVPPFRAGRRRRPTPADASSAFEPDGQLGLAAVGAEEPPGVVGHLERRALADRVDHQQVAALPRQLGPAVVQRVARARRRSRPRSRRSTWPGSRAADQLDEHVGVLRERERRRVVRTRLLDLVVGQRGGPEVRDRGRHHDGVRALGRDVHGVAQLQRRPDPHAPRRPRDRRGRPCAPRRA